MGTFETEKQVSQELFCEYCGNRIGVYQHHPEHPIQARCYHAACWMEKELGGTYDYTDATDYVADRGTD